MVQEPMKLYGGGNEDGEPWAEGNTASASWLGYVSADDNRRSAQMLTLCYTESSTESDNLYINLANQEAVNITTHSRVLKGPG